MKSGFGDYLKKNWWIGGCAFLFSCLCFLVMFTGQTVMIDEEFHMTADADPTLFLYGSRYTNYLLGRLFFDSRIIPFWTDFFALFLWNLSAFLFGYAFFEEEHGKLIRFFSLAYFSTVPFCVGEMFAFSEIISEIACAFVFTAMAFLLTVRFCDMNIASFRDKGYWKWALFKFFTLVLLVFAIGSYQAFICVYLTAVAAFALKRAYKREKWFVFALESLGTCMVAAFIYILINKAIQGIIGSTNYLSDNYVGWKSDGVLKAGFMALANVVRVSFAIPIRGEIVYGGISICVLTVLFIAFSIKKIIGLEKIKDKLEILFLSVLLIMAPFSLYIALGTYRTHGRVLLALSIAGMAEILFVYKESKKKIVKELVCLCFAVLLILNAVNMNRIYYSAYKAYVRDCEYTDSIIEQINRVTDPAGKTIVFVGAMEEYDDIKPKNVTLGASFFSWDGGANHRLRAFFSLRGLNCREPSASDYGKALDLSKTMKIGSSDPYDIRVEDGLIVVYFGEPTEKWYATNMIQ